MMRADDIDIDSSAVVEDNEDITHTVKEFNATLEPGTQHQEFQISSRLIFNPLKISTVVIMLCKTMLENNLNSNFLSEESHKLCVVHHAITIRVHHGNVFFSFIHAHLHAAMIGQNFGQLLLADLSTKIFNVLHQQTVLREIQK